MGAWHYNRTPWFDLALKLAMGVRGQSSTLQELLRRRAVDRGAWFVSGRIQVRSALMRLRRRMSRDPAALLPTLALVFQLHWPATCCSPRAPAPMVILLVNTADFCFFKIAPAMLEGGGVEAAGSYWLAPCTFICVTHREQGLVVPQPCAPASVSAPPAAASAQILPYKATPDRPATSWGRLSPTHCTWAGLRPSICRLTPIPHTAP